ncbi:MAG: hypothetical protein J6066_02100 [Lachnospiraceae bacterium]|nr:hypothetical protein [Lachnospiraceae bacterium]
MKAMNWKLKFGLIALVMAVVLVVMGKDAFNFMKDPIIVKNADDVKKLKAGDHVQFDMTMSYGCLIKEITTTTKYGVKQSEKESSRYYLIPYLGLDDEGYEVVDYLLTVKLPSKDFSKAESAVKAFDDFWDDITLPVPTTPFLSIDGIVTNMKDEEKKYVDDYMKSASKKYMDYIYVSTPSKSASFIMLAIGGGALLLGALFVVLFILGLKKDKERLEEMRANNPTYYQAPAGITFNNNVNDPYTQNPYAFDPNTDPRFNGMAQGNPVAPNNQYNAQPMNGNFNEVAPTNGQYGASADNSGNFNEIPNNDPFNNQQ